MTGTEHFCGAGSVGGGVRGDFWAITGYGGGDERCDEESIQVLKSIYAYASYAVIFNFLFVQKLADIHDHGGLGRVRVIRSREARMLTRRDNVIRSAR